MIKFYLTALALILIDQITKLLIPGTKSYGSAFGILQGYRWLFIIVGLAVAIFLFLYKDKLKGIGYFGGVLFFSGTAGNLIDRIFLGHVRDFIDLGFWSSFNLADAYITLGAILLGIYLLRKED